MHKGMQGAKEVHARVGFERERVRDRVNSARDPSVRRVLSLSLIKTVIVIKEPSLLLEPLNLYSRGI